MDDAASRSRRRVFSSFTALHVLGHLPELARNLRAGRSIALAGALVGRLVLAIVLIPDFGSWTHHPAGLYHR
jgi:hypothetical protein